MNTLEGEIRKYYNDKTLPAKSVHRMLGATAHARSGIWGYVLIAATVILGIGLYTSLDRAQSLTDRVLQEIVMNHEKALDIEVAAADYEELQSRMDRIDFDISPNAAIRKSYELKGGRYCSIQGELAAQLKIRHRETRIVHTLYVTRLSPTLDRLSDRSYIKTATRIRLWKDNGRFFGLAVGSSE